MAESIQALQSLAFPNSRHHNRQEAEPHGDFASWLPAEDEANTNVAPVSDFLVPFLSLEDMLVLALAQEEVFAVAIKAYETAAEQTPVDEGQYAFEFHAENSGAGEIVSENL